MSIRDIKQFCTVPPPYGGVTVYVKRLISALSNDGYIVGGYYSTECSDDYVRKSILYDEWKWMEIAKFPLKIWKYVKDTIPYKVIHSHFSLEGMLYLWTLKMFFKKKIIVTVHNSMVTNYFAKTNLVNRFFLKKMLESDVEWITVSQEGKEQMLKLPVKMYNDIHVIPAYIPDLNTSEILLKVEMQRYIDLHTKNIVFYGHSFMLNNGVDVYGFESALDVYAKLLENSESGIGLILCLAEIKDTLKIEQLHQMALDLNIDDKIYWQMGAIDNMQQLWRQIDVYFRPTSTDGDSVAIREAIDCGAIVVASDVTARPEGVVTYKFGNNKDAFEKIQNSLLKPKKLSTPNMEYYIQMRNIYDKVLENR